MPLKRQSSQDSTSPTFRKSSLLDHSLLRHTLILRASQTAQKIGDRHARCWWAPNRSQALAHRHSDDWSCPYDSVVVPLFHTFRTQSQDFAVRHLSPYMARFAEGVHSLLLESSQFQRHLNTLRHGVCNDLSLADPKRFLRHGRQMISVMEALCATFKPSVLEAFGHLVCTSCGSSQLSHSNPLGHNADRTTMQFACDLQLEALRGGCGASSDRTV